MGTLTAWLSRQMFDKCSRRYRLLHLADVEVGYHACEGYPTHRSPPWNKCNSAVYELEVPRLLRPECRAREDGLPGARIHPCQSQKSQYSARELELYSIEAFSQHAENESSPSSRGGYLLEHQTRGGEYPASFKIPWPKG